MYFKIDGNMVTITQHAASHLIIAASPKDAVEFVEKFRTALASHTEHELSEIKRKN